MIQGSHQLYKLNPLDKGFLSKTAVFKPGRVLIGRVESCDIVINSSKISAIHAVIEIFNDIIRIYDLNSTNGTYVNGEKIVVSDLKIGDKVKFAHIEFDFKKYVKEEAALPPVLDVLEPSLGSASVFQNREDVLPADIPNFEKKAKDFVYPLADDNRADYSEYIFEDDGVIYPIFKYKIGQQSIEIIILFNDLVQSVDYIPLRDGTFSLVGFSPLAGEIEFPYLAKTEKQKIIEIKNKDIYVIPQPSYEVFHLSRRGAETKESIFDPIMMSDTDIFRMSKGSLEIYIRQVSAPPKVAAAPFFRRDKELRKYLIRVSLLLILFFLSVSFYEVDPEVEKEKIPDRIATVLYRKELNVSKTKAVEKTEKAPKKMQQSKQKVVKEKQEPKKKVADKEIVKKVTPTEKTKGSETAKKVQEVKKTTDPAPKTAAKPTPAKKAPTLGGLPTQKAVAPKTAKLPSQNIGKVDVFKSNNLKSSLNSLLAKGSKLKGAEKLQGGESNNIAAAKVGGGSSDSVKAASVSGLGGSLTGLTTGKLDDSRGAEGLSAKRSLFTAGIPSQTVVLGSMDPDDIRRILREHIPQFRFCYQRELDNNAKDVQGVVGLVFTIGASGNVSKAAVDGRTRLPTSVSRCVMNVLRGIQFPAPRGGGVVEVKQPINFYPREI